MKQLTFAKAGMPAMELAFIMALAGCPIGSDPEPQPGPDGFGVH